MAQDRARHVGDSRGLGEDSSFVRFLLPVPVRDLLDRLDVGDRTDVESCAS